jgi:hypothetical protein
MSVTIEPTAPGRRSDSGKSAVSGPSRAAEASRGSSRAVEPSPVTARVPRPQPRAAVTLFEVPFASVMSDSDIALLVRMLGLSTRMHTNTSSRHDSAGFARLDHYSGIFLKRGVIEGEWLLEARSWGRPASQCVHEWHVLAAGAAHQLDHAVSLPEVLHASPNEIRNRPLGRAANKRLARVRRRLVGLQ